MKEFYSSIKKWTKRGKSSITNNGNELICLVHENIKDDYLHVLFYPLDRKKQKNFEKEYELKKYTKLKDYYEFLKEHNGAVLYSGAIVFFGYTNNSTINTFVEPSSLARMNGIERFVKDNPNYIFIGNIVHREMDNVNIYINKMTGYMLLMHKGEIFKEYDTISNMLDFILKYYEPHYNENGENLDFNNRKKNVYENIQLL